MLDLLAAPTRAQLRCGTHIAKNQPDVEVCAMSLCKLPSNRTEFDAMRGTREFIIGKFLVLALGPPGFGKVPYNSKRSAGQKEDAGKPLYESTDDGRVRLFSFEKGKTNKDKGERVDALESSGFLQPGLVLSFFLREDFWDPPKIAPSVAGDETVGVGTLLALQLSSGNVDAATKGYLLKLKKAKVLVASADLSATLIKLPRSEQEYDSLASKYRIDCPAMKGSLDSSNDMRCFAMQSLGPDACAFAHEDGVLISNAVTGNSECFRDDIFVPDSVLLQCLQVADRGLALKLLNVALAVEAIGTLVKTCASNVLLSSDDVHPLVALALVLDLNVLLSLDALNTPEIGFFLRSANDGPFESRDVFVSKKSDHIHWHNTKQVYATDADAAQLSFTLHAAEHTGPDGAPPASNQLSIGRSGAYKTLSLYLAKQGNTRKIMDLEMRIATDTSARQKRKRPEMFDDEPY
jgi:hypothetical protein